MYSYAAQWLNQYLSYMAVEILKTFASCSNSRVSEGLKNGGHLMKWASFLAPCNDGFTGMDPNISILSIVTVLLEIY